jgi:hypothetical protein
VNQGDESRCVTLQEAQNGAQGTLSHVQEEHPLCNGPPCIVVLARRLGKCIPPEDKGGGVCKSKEGQIPREGLRIELR